MLYPLTFAPLFKERVWGGRRLAELYGKALPPGAVIGESWEITDRPEGVSQITNGPLAGRSLRWLMEHHGAELLGPVPALHGRFPLLVKLLDAQDVLSLQVHPPAACAAELGGEPKTEMWYVADATPTAAIYVGLRPGTTRAEFSRKIADGTVAECFHRHPVRAGDAMFLPSGRVHAIGAGNVIFEIQQNSDTTYRVFDWNRTGLDGQPRELHVAQAMASIDFGDVAPPLLPHAESESGAVRRRPLVDHELFSCALLTLPSGGGTVMDHAGPVVLAVTAGQVQVTGGGVPVTLTAGQFALLPADCGPARLEGTAGSAVLVAEPH